MRSSTSSQIFRTGLIGALTFAFGLSLAAASARGVFHTRRAAVAERTKVHGKALEGNLSNAIAADAPAKLDAAPLSRQLTAAVDRGDVPGVVALVVNREGVMYEGAFGKRDAAHNAPMPADAIFRLASMTKPITSVAIMMLLEEGKIRLDDPVSAHLSGFDDLRVITTFSAADGKYETRPATRVMTIRHLLSHTSGIGYAFSSPIVAKLMEGPPKNEWNLPLLHDPGEKWTYGASTRVLGLIVEHISGQSLDAFMRERIFQPLGMTETSFVVPPDKVSRVPTVHQRVDGKLVEQANSATQQSPVRGDGGLYSTARDYGRFVQMLLNGGRLGGVRLLTETSVRTMGENQIGAIFIEQQPAADPARTKPFPLGAGHDKFGLGFQIAAADERYAKFRSPGSLSWAGINNTHFWIDPVKHIGAVVLMQVLPFYDDAAIKTLRDFEELVYRQVH